MICAVLNCRRWFLPTGRGRYRLHETKPWSHICPSCTYTKKLRCFTTVENIKFLIVFYLNAIQLNVLRLVWWLEHNIFNPFRANFVVYLFNHQGFHCFICYQIYVPIVETFKCFILLSIIKHFHNPHFSMSVIHL